MLGLPANSSSYTDFADISVNSEALYAGNLSSGSGKFLQFRSSNSNSGLVTTKSGGKVKSITVTWDESTASDRKIDIYGKKTAYASASELYKADNQGALIGSIVYGNSTSLTIEGDYEYIGMRSKNGSLYCPTITIVWETEETVVSAPQIEGTTPFESTTNVTITAEDGAKIYYTTDGETEPTTSSTEYNNVFTISNTTTVKAIAVKDGKSSRVVTKTFTKIQTLTIAEAQNATDGTVCKVNGTVVATCTRGCLLGDGTGYIYYFAGGSHEYVVGDKLDVSGAVSPYGGSNQFTSDATITKTGTGEVTHPTAQSMSGDDVTAWAVNPEIKYVTILGTLNISGNYYNVTIDGTTIVGSIIYPDDELKEQLETGKSYSITGYAIYTSGSSTKYMNILPVSVTDVTGISNITSDTITEDAPIYNLAGQRVSKETKGILIQNGKKFINK